MNLQTLPEEALKEILALTEAKKRLDLREKAQNAFMPFVHHVYDNFIEGRHHRIIAEKLERVARGELKRLIINMPPRHSKSEFASYLMPAWFLGRNPKLKIIQATHNTELAVRFGRKVRDLIDDPHYRDIFPGNQPQGGQQRCGQMGY
jgi:hypothetical protein